MKKVLSIVAVSAFMLTAGSALAGGPGKRMTDIPDGCNEDCLAQLDELQSGQAEQNELLNNHTKLLNAHSAEIEDLKKGKDLYNPFYVRGAFKFGWGSQNAGGSTTGLNTGFLPGTYRDADGRLLPGERSRNSTRYIDSKTYFGGQGAIGKYLFNNFRVELEYAYQGADVDGDNYDGDIGLHTVMVNAFYEIPITDMFGLYGVVGGGYGNYDLDVKRSDIRGLSNKGYPVAPRDYYGIGGSSDVFAYKIGAGLSIFFLESRALALDIGYEYLGTTDAHIRTSRAALRDGTRSAQDWSTDITSIHSHNVVTSLRFMF